MRRRGSRLVMAQAGLLLALSLASACKSGEDGAAEGKQPSERPVAIASAKVRRADVPIDLDGIGSVAAYKTVIVRAQVDGRLDSVNFTEGQEVKRGQLLAQIDPRPYRIQMLEAQGNLARDQSLLTGSQLNLERYEKLSEQKFVGQQQLDDTRGQLGQYQGAVQYDLAQIEAAKLNLSYARITSPIDGVTGVRLVDQGNLVRASDTTGIVMVTQLDPISVLFTLPQDDLPLVARHMGAEQRLLVDAYDRDGSDKLASGELLLVDNQINQATATIRLKAVFPNPRRALWPNQFVKVRLHVSTEQDVLVVPSMAIQRGPRGTFVYVVKADSTVELRPVQLTRSLAELSVIRKGLEEGELVVTEGHNQLRPGSRVQSGREQSPVADALGDAGAAR